MDKRSLNSIFRDDIEAEGRKTDPEIFGSRIRSLRLKILGVSIFDRHACLFFKILEIFFKARAGLLNSTKKVQCCIIDTHGMIRSMADILSFGFPRLHSVGQV